MLDHVLGHASTQTTEPSNDGAFAYFQEAKDLQKQGAFQGALEAVRRALSLRSDWVEAMALEAECLLRLSQPCEAIDRARRAEVLSPCSHNSWLSLGLGLSYLGTPVEAIAVLEGCIEEPTIDSGYKAAAVELLSQCYHTIGDHRTAVQRLRPFLTQLPSGEAHIEYADHLAAMGSEREAREILSLVLRSREPKGIYAREYSPFYGADTRFRRDSIRRDMSHILKAASEKQPDSSYCMSEYWDRLMLHRQFGKALASVDRFLRKHPHDHYAHYWRGLLLAGQGNHEWAIDSYTMALREDAPDPVWWMHYSYSLLKREKNTECRHAVEKALTIYGHDYRAHLIGACTYALLGDLSLARGHLVRARTCNPGLAAVAQRDRTLAAILAESDLTSLIVA